MLSYSYSKFWKSYAPPATRIGDKGAQEWGFQLLFAEIMPK